MLIFPVIAAVVIAADQITKYLVRSNMQPGDSISVIGDWMRIYYVRNTGTAFSMFAGNRWVTIVLTSVLLILCLIFIIRESGGSYRPMAILMMFVFSGGVSNMIDRMTLGYVTDMISCGSFAVFNVADIAVTCGCFLAAAWALYMMREESRAESAAGDGKGK